LSEVDAFNVIYGRFDENKNTTAGKTEQEILLSLPA